MNLEPLAKVTANHGGKEKFVEAVAALVELVGCQLPDESKEDLRKRLRSVSNAKLMRLSSVLSDVKQRFGTREKLADAIVAAERRVKDTDYRKSLTAQPVPRLRDKFRVVERRAGRTAAKAT